MKDQMQHHSRSADQQAESLDSSLSPSPQAMQAAGRRRNRWFVAIAFLALGACSLPPYSAPPAAKAPPPPKPYAGAQSRFSKPAAANQPRLVLTEPEVAGHRVQVIDEDGPFWINLTHSHDATAGQANQVKVTHGRWWIDPSGLLCLRSSVWWKDGTCFELFGGHQFAEATVIHSLNRDNGPNTYYPFAVVGQAN